jgi:hypothetical protein
MNIFEITLPATPHATLLESVCRDLTRDQRRVVEGIVNQLRPLFEAPLTQTQIDQIFSQAEQNLTGAGVNRSGVGQAVDVTKAVGSKVGSAVGSVNNTINKLGSYLQTTAPVQYFDQKFEDLKQKISAKLGADSKTMAVIDQLGQYAKANPGKTAFVIGALTAVASFAGGPAGGAVAGQVLRGAVELLKGEKLSTAVGRGAKSAAIGGALGAGITALGDYFGNIKVVASQIPGYVGLTKLDFIRQDVQVGGNNPGYFFGDLRGIEIPSQLAPKVKLLLDQVSNYIDRNDWAGAGKFWNEVTDIVDNPEVRQYVKEITGNNQTLYDQAVANAANFKEVAAKISSTLRAAVQGGLAGASAAPAPAAKTPTAGTATNQVREHHIRLTNKEVHEIFAVAGSLLNEGPMDWLKTKGKNLTTKVTADKLKSMWTKDGKPMDSEKIAAILRQAGVKDDVVASAFNAVEAPVPSWVRTPAAAQPAAEPAAEPAATQDQGGTVFGNMAQTLKTMQPADTTSTGGSVTQTSTGLKHTAKTAGKTAQPDTATAQSPAPDAAQIIANLEKTVPKDVLMSVAAELLKKYTSRATPK